jgi:hypothetical protein
VRTFHKRRQETCQATRPLRRARRGVRFRRIWRQARCGSAFLSVGLEMTSLAKTISGTKEDGSRRRWGIFRGGADRLSRAEAHKFLHYAGTRRGTSERDVAREKTASLSGSSDMISIVVTCRNADHDFDHHRAIDSERRDRERSCCSKTREHGRAQGARVGACAASRRQPRSTPCRVGASFGSSGGSGVVQTSCRATLFQAPLRIPEIAS